MLHRLIALLGACLAPAAPAGAADLFGIHVGTGGLYSISTVDASVTLIGSTNVGGIGSLLRAPDGYLYGVSIGAGSSLWRIDPATALSTLVGPLGSGFAIEGGLALDANGVTWGVLLLGARLFTIDLATGVETPGPTVGGGSVDINGIAFRSDGALIGIERVSNALVRIDTTTGAVTPIATLSPMLGGAGGMAVQGGTAYFATYGPASGTPGSNELWTVDLYTGAHALVGNFGPLPNGVGFGGIAEGEPSAFSLFCSGDGSGAPCPCGNQGQPGRGCQNSAGTGGALLLYASGTTSPDTLVLHASGELPSALTILLQGNAITSPGVVFGDGLRCAGGILLRLYVKSAVNGAVRVPEPGDPSITARSAALGDPIGAGERRYYQTYYRDPVESFCTSPPGSTFNSSNALKIVW